MTVDDLTAYIFDPESRRGLGRESGVTPPLKRAHIEASVTQLLKSAQRLRGAIATAAVNYERF
jgi:hypothetical protein